MHKPPPAFVAFVKSSPSIKDAAGALCTSPAYVYQIMKGIRPIPPKHVLRWAAAIGVSVRELRPDMAA